jgi:hypothetical protein
MNWLKHPLEHHHLGVLSGASKTISEPMVCLALSMHLSCTDTNTIFKWTKTRFYMTHVTLEFQRGRPKRFLRIWYVRRKPCTYLVSRLALYQMNWIKHPLELCHLGVLSGASKMISEPTVCLAQTMHLSCVKISTISQELNQASTWLCHLGVLSGASKMIFEPTVCLAQTMHLSWTDTNTISKWTKTRFHMTHIT